MSTPAEAHSDRNYWLVLGFVFTTMVAFILASQEPAIDPRPLDTWLRDLDATESFRRARAEAAVRRMGVRAVPALLARLKSTFTNDQAHAILGFAALGDEARPALPKLAGLLRHEPTTSSAARALAAIGPAGVPLLTNSLSSPFRPVRTSCARALGRLKSGGKTAVPALVSVLNDSDDDLRYFATRALGSLAVDPIQAVPALVSRLEDQNVEVRKVAARSLGQFKRLASVAVPALVKALNSDDLGMRLSAAAALREINPDLGHGRLK